MGGCTSSWGKPADCSVGSGWEVEGGETVECMDMRMLKRQGKEAECLSGMLWLHREEHYRLDSFKACLCFLKKGGIP